MLSYLHWTSKPHKKYKQSEKFDENRKNSQQVGLTLNSHHSFLMSSLIFEPNFILIGAHLPTKLDHKADL